MSFVLNLVGCNGADEEEIFASPLPVVAEETKAAAASSSSRKRKVRFDLQDNGSSGKMTNAGVEAVTSKRLCGPREEEKERSTEASSSLKAKVPLLKGRGSRRNFKGRAFTVLPVPNLPGAAKEPTLSKESDHVFSTQTAFDDLGVSPQLLKVLTSTTEKGGLGYTKPTVVQRMVVPLALKGSDVLVKSETGSGKTLSYILPIVHNLHTRSPRICRSDGVCALILAPTRELCMQIADVAMSAAKPFYWINIGTVVGGEKKKSEKARLRKGVNILVATPGRILDHLRNTESLRASLSARAIRWLVIDEADRLMDAGFEKQLNNIFEIIDDCTPPGCYRQTLMVSATINDDVQRLTSMIQSEPKMVDADKISLAEGAAAHPSSGKNASSSEPETSAFSTPKQLVQHYVVVDMRQRLVALAAFLRRQLRRSGGTAKIIVFVSNRACVEFLHVALARIEWPPARKSVRAPLGFGTSWWKLHGSIPQAERGKTIKSFASAQGGVLICTDVAARGLDMPSVDWIVQYDPPSEVSEYVHRVGRTARRGRTGSALLFLIPSELEYINILKGHDLHVAALQTGPLFLSLLASFSALEAGQRKQKHSHGDAEKATKLLQIKFEDLVANDEDSAASKKNHVVYRKLLKLKREDGFEGKPLIQFAKDAYLAYLRAYAVHSKETKHIFQPRKLHLGHVARAFALREAPSAISKHTAGGKKGRKAKGRDLGSRARKGKQHERQRPKSFSSRAAVSEFGS